MALSALARNYLTVALANKKISKEVADAIDSASNLHAAAHVANVTAVDATDLASAEALANANKVTINAILAALQAAGLMS